MNDLDTRTLEETFQRLVHDGEKDAALTVASMAFGSLRGTPRDWLEDNFPNGL
jgi:cell pole-organizing protein PopZ